MAPRINVRQKGANGELEIAAILQKVVDEVFTNCGHEPPKLRRNVEQTQVGGEDLVGLPWYSFEVKRVERIDLDKWWQQTVVQAARKPPLASMALAQRFGGWKSLAAAEVVQGASGDAFGSVPGAGCGALGAGAGEVGSAGSQEGREGAVVASGKGMAGRGKARQGQGVTGQFSDEHYRHFGTLGGSLADRGLPLPLWAIPRGSMLGISGKGFVASRSVLMGGSLGDCGLGGLRQGQGNPVSSPVEGRSNLVATDLQSEGPNAEKPLPMARKAVLLWRINRQPWQVRFLGTLVSHNAEKLVSVVDTSLETWLKLFKMDLDAIVRG